MWMLMCLGVWFNTQRMRTTLWVMTGQCVKNVPRLPPAKVQSIRQLHLLGLVVPNAGQRRREQHTAKSHQHPYWSCAT
jgi:hypothetical protein